MKKQPGNEHLKKQNKKKKLQTREEPSQNRVRTESEPSQDRLEAFQNCSRVSLKTGNRKFLNKRLHLVAEVQSRQQDDDVTVKVIVSFMHQKKKRIEFKSQEGFLDP